MFNHRSTAEEVTQDLDLTGLNVVITGVNSGLGFETMRVLAKRGAHVIALARSLEKAKAACAQVEGETTPLACELSDMDDVARCAKQIVEMHISIDRLICNAGLMALPKLVVKNGLEMQFLCNHMGHFLLINLLADKLIEANQARVTILSSMAHRYSVKGGIDFSNLDGKEGYHDWKFYGQSKLANLLCAVAMHDKLIDSGVMVNSLHPGVINTNLGRNLSGVLGKLMALPGISRVMQFSGGKSIAQGAATTCYVATHPSLKGVSGKYFSDCHVARTSRHGQNEALAEKLWSYSNEYLSKYLSKEPSKAKAADKELSEV